MKNVIQIFSKTLSRILPVAEHYGKEPKETPIGWCLSVHAKDITQRRDGSIAIVDSISGRKFIVEGSSLIEARKERIEALKYSAERASIAKRI